MVRFTVILLGLLTLALPAQAALVTWEISGSARTGSQWFGISAGDVLSGSVTIETDVHNDRGHTGDVAAFTFRAGNTIFDMSGGSFKASYRLQDDEPYRFNIHAKTQAFHQDKRQFLMNVTPQKTMVRVKDLGNDWIYVDDIVIERPTLAIGALTFNSNLSTVAEPAALVLFSAALGVVGVAGLRRRRTA